MKIQFQQVRWFRPVGSFLHSIYLSGRKLARVADQVFDHLLLSRLVETEGPKPGMQPNKS